MLPKMCLIEVEVSLAVVLFNLIFILKSSKNKIL